MRAWSAIAGAALLSGLLLVGCGGQSDNQQVRGVVNNFTVDVGQNRWEAACPLTTGQERSLCQSLRAVGGAGPSSICSQVSPSSATGQACARVRADVKGLSGFTSLTISKVVVTGANATVAFNGSSEVMNLTKTGGRWLISSA